MPRCWNYFLLSSALMPWLLLEVAHAEPAKLDYNRDVRPILANCFACHGPDDKHREADLRLDTREGAIASVVKPGNPGDSELVRRILSTDPDEVMPPEKTRKSLTAREKEILQRWIAEGAEYQSHWAFRPVADPPLPTLKNVAGIKNGIDQFIRAELERHELTPSPEAPKAKLLRRVYLDLIGLLPSPDEVAAFENDNSPDAYDKVVDRLLQNPHYGERWARHWLDQARYADSNGYSIDSERTQWPYRDWVIRSLNEDLPFTDFTIQQLAGDLLPNATPLNRIASAFHRNTMINEEGGTDAEQFRNEIVVDRVSTTGAVWLGLTLGCAQCHSHKFDPISHKEFYELFAFYNQNTDINNRGETMEVYPGDVLGEKRTLPADFEATELKEATTEEQLAAGETADDQAKKNQDTKAKKSAEEDKKKKRDDEKKREEKRKQALGVARVMIMKDLPKPRETYLLQRGDFLNPDKKLGVLTPNVPACLPPLGETKGPITRLDLARWLVRRDHPLTPRVTVNRVWMHLFGQGLVETESDFGLQGSPPTHPELLDWVATRFMDDGWSPKKLLRLIVTSATYRQDSVWRDDARKIDPRNQWLSQQNRVRLDAEIFRDTALCASGLLNETLGGPPVKPEQPEGVYAFTQNAKSWKTSPGTDKYRRAIYTLYYRSAPYPLFTTFDAPTFSATCTRRPNSNTPLQALNIANDATFVECARQLASRVWQANSGDDETADRARLQAAFSLCFARSPNEKEQAILLDYVAREQAAFNNDPSATKAFAFTSPNKNLDPARAAAWTAVARVLLNTDEFATRE